MHLSNYSPRYYTKILTGIGGGVWGLMSQIVKVVNETVQCKESVSKKVKP
jgi:hypothetical protein